MEKKQSKDARRPRKLTLHAETLRTLSEQEIQNVAGGGSTGCPSANPADGFGCQWI
jgi:hypothetical protein